MSRFAWDIVLSTGTIIEPPFGIVGINHESAVFGGYDQRIWDPESGADEWFGTPLSPADRAELADVMIERWQKFKADAQKANA